MNTEITETSGWVFFDGECSFCRGWVERTHGLLLRRGYHFVPLQSAWARAKLGLSPEAPLQEMKLLTARGEICGGADALVQLCRAVWWLWLFYAVAQVPGVKPLMQIAYRRLAAKRHCFGRQCRIPAAPRGQPRHGASAFYELP